MTLPQLELNTLSHSDGSATYTAYGCTVVASVNGPVEVTRRDELPEAATIDVAVRPAAGIGGIRERHFESLIHRTLRQVVRVQDLPRTLIQVTLQITTGMDQDSASGRSDPAESNLYLLPLLLNATTLALLTTAIPLAMTPIASIVAIAADGSITLIPSWHSIAQAASVHVFAYSTHDQLLLAESEGSFDLQTWERAAAATKEACLRPEPGDEERSDTQPPLESLLRAAMASKLRQKRNWAGAAG